MRIPDLSTDRLVLRRWQPDDAPFAFDLYSRWEVQRFLGRPPRVLSEPAEAEMLVRRLRRREDAHRAYRVVALAGTGDAVGTVMLQPLPASGPSEPLRPSGDTEIGWHFHPDRWGRGYATEAAAALLLAAFGTGLTRVLAVTAPENTASQRVCERIGMRSVGLTDAYYNVTTELFERTA
ncbi:GNAT family N-acetyltransferase [Leifsonia sp. NPDC058194]|uniref:GNAT family N-acetyltransferase n=1 Tax=Leifsonia sp. NPDC058194 TaxID=3346374 RepID=UPI0036DE04FF